MAVISVEATRAGGAATGAGRLGGDSAIAVALFITGLFVFFLRQPAGIADAMRLALPDSDDAMRLLGVRDLLAGQGWLDPHQYRYLAPDGVAMHWSRLVDAPLAGGILALTPLLGAALAESVVVTTWPMLLFVAYAGVLLWGGARLFGARAGGLAVLVAAQMVVFGDLFAPGRIDHHNIQVILVTLAAIGFGLATQGRSGALFSGVAAALSLAVGLETMPVVALVGCGFALLWIVRGADAARPFLSFSASLAIAAPLFFAVQTAPSLWAATACDALSAPWLLIVSGEGLAGAALVAATPRLNSWRSRFAAALVLGWVPLLAFALAAPMCLQGPYAIVPEPYRSLWLRDILEAYSFQRFLMVNTSPGDPVRGADAACSDRGIHWRVAGEKRGAADPRAACGSALARRGARAIPDPHGLHHVRPVSARGRMVRRSGTRCCGGEAAAVREGRSGTLRARHVRAGVGGRHCNR